MDQQLELESKHREVAEKIHSFKGRIAPTWTIKKFARLLPEKLSDRSFIYWILIAIILNFAMWVPGLLVSRVLGEPIWDNNIWFAWFLGAQTCMAGLLTSHFALQNLLDELATRVVNKIVNIQSLDEFLQWVYSSWDVKNIIGVVITYSGLWVYISTWRISEIRGEFVGYGPAVTTLIGGILLGVSVNYIIWLLLLSRKLSSYNYNLNSVVPSHSEITNVLANMFNKHLYITAGFFGTATLVISSVELATVALPIVVLGWLIIILQFLFNRDAINKIVDSAKWITLNNLQEQINHLVKSQDISEKEPAEKLLRLTETYERIVTSNSSALNLKSSLNFFSQMMLPLLGLLLANLDKILKLLP